MSNLQKDVENKIYIFRTCNVCGCKQYSTNFARHVKTKKHKEADYAYNKFELEKYHPPVNKSKEFMILS